MHIIINTLPAMLVLSSQMMFSDFGMGKVYAQINPFDIQGSQSSVTSPDESGIATGKTFYRAGKEAMDKPMATQKTEGAPEEESPPDFEEVLPEPEEDELKFTESPESLQENTSSVEEEADAKENENNAAEVELATHSAAPKQSSAFSISSIILYATVGIVCVGALLMLVLRKKKKYMSAAATAPTPEATGTPVDSVRVKKALAAFHESDAPL